MKALLLILALAVSIQCQSDLKAKTKTFRNSKRFSVEYDKFKDRSTISVGPFATPPEGKGARGMFGVYARFFFQGPEVKTPVETFYLGIVCYGRDWQFLYTEKVYLLIDGERLAIEAQRSSKIGDSRWSSLTSEWLVIPVSADVFQRVVNAKSVELKAGNFETKLKEEHQTAFRDLLSLSNT